MKTLIFSDLHLGQHKRVSESDGITVLKYILEQASNKADAVIFGGDLFDRGDHIRPSLVLSMLTSFKRFDKTTIILPGQHDSEDFDGKITVMDILYEAKYDNVYRLRGSGEISVTGKSVVYCQHDRDKERLQSHLLDMNSQEGLIFIGHFLVDELLEEDGMSSRIKGDVSFKKHLKHLNCDHYFLGDYHKHVHIPELNLTSIGTCCPTSFRDAGCDASFLIYDADTNSFERELIDDAPLFVTCKKGFLLENMPISNKSFYRMKVDTEDEMKKIMEENNGRLNLEILVESEDANIENRLNIDFDVLPDEVIRRYCDFMGVDDTFIKKGLEYV